MKHEAKYDETNNIMFFKYIGLANSKDEAKFLLDSNRREYEKSAGHKCWVIVDISEMTLPRSSYAFLYARGSKILAEKFVIGHCTVGTNLHSRIGNIFYNKFSGRINPMFTTRDEAIKWILEQQKIKGKTALVE
ncbi:MAG: hypothetical protein KAH30_06355 [Caldisericia bacterium]|nr:hypothetical protein [Caldisericia bacterium]